MTFPGLVTDHRLTPNERDKQNIQDQESVGLPIEVIRSAIIVEVEVLLLAVVQLRGTDISQLIE